MKKKLIWSTISILLIAGFCLAGAFLYHFYSLLSFSDQLFQIKHNHFAHLEFHTDKWNYESGDTLKIYASSTSLDSVFVSLYNLYEEDTLLKERPFKGDFQPVSKNVSLTGTNWQAVLQHLIPMNATTGWYIITLKNRDFVRHASIFVVPPVDQVQKKTAILLSSNTWNAYNHWGGKSLYTRNYSHTVSFNRPQPLSNPFIENTYAHDQWYYQAANKDKYLTDLLDSVGTNFDVYAEDELHRSPEKLKQYKTLISSTHSEYWSAQMMENLNNCLDHGASWLCFSGNTAGYQIKLDLEKRTEYVDKHTDEWESLDPEAVQRPFGTFYSLIYGFQTYAPYKIVNDSSWVWEGLDIAEGQLFGEKSDVYDYTFMIDGWLENLWNLTKKGDWGAASGMEIDLVGKHTPDNWVYLAKGLNSSNHGDGTVVVSSDLRDDQEVFGADLGYYEHEGGGIVFHASSIAFNGAIPYDSIIRQMIVNLVRRTNN